MRCECENGGETRVKPAVCGVQMQGKGWVVCKCRGCGVGHDRYIYVSLAGKAARRVFTDGGNF